MLLDKESNISEKVKCLKQVSSVDTTTQAIASYQERKEAAEISIQLKIVYIQIAKLHNVLRDIQRHANIWKHVDFKQGANTVIIPLKK